VAVHKKGGNAYELLLEMLVETAHRGGDAYGVASSKSVSIAKSVDQLSIEESPPSTVVGHNLSKVFPTDEPQPVVRNKLALVFEGRIFPRQKPSDVEVAAQILSENWKNGGAELIKKFDGSYVFAAIKDGEVVVGRDSVGTCPLYFGENKECCAVASERKALWKIGIEKPRSFPPGTLAFISSQGFSFKTVKQIAMPKKTLQGDERYFVNVVQKVLLESVCERVLDTPRVAVAFSGGLDSSIIAFLAKKCGCDVHLISVGLEGQSELEHAKLAADMLNLPLYTFTFKEEDVEHIVPKVLWLIEEPNPVNLSIAIPIFWAAQLASKLNLKILLAGQGSDELFGGYHRYLTLYAKQGAEALKKTLYTDVVTAYKKNFQRDNKVCSFHKTELRLPFADRELVELALSTPLNLKIASPTDGLRKRILRNIAENLKIPPTLAKRKKKAVQYATGVNKALKKLAKKESLSPKEYVLKTFRKIYPNVRTANAQNSNSVHA